MLNKMRVFLLLDTQTRTRLMGHTNVVRDGRSEDLVVDDGIVVPLPAAAMASDKAAAVEASFMDAKL